MTFKNSISLIKNDIKPVVFRALMLLIFSFSFITLSAKENAKKPNIVFIMADDLGPGWVDYLGTNPKIKTPNLERLAKNGMVFNKAYASAPVCSPTRASCITGKTPASLKLTVHLPGVDMMSYLRKRGGLGKGGSGIVDADFVDHIPKDVPTYASELKKLGYQTAFIGKWHIAGVGGLRSRNGVLNPEWLPDHYGFDINIAGASFGQPKSWFSPYQNASIENGPKGEYLTNRLGDEAVKYIKENHEKPFHVSLWLYSVHTPIKAPSELVQSNGGDAYLAMLECMDNAVGKVIKVLEETNTLDNTIICFYSDNGGDKPTEWLAEKKGSLLEGGLRVPMVVSWPGVTKKGTTCDVPVTTMDFMPTFINAGGGDASKIKGLEGLDLKPLLQGKKTLKREALYWHYPHNRHEVNYYMGSSVLKGDWKFFKGYGKTKDALFNIKEDPLEKKNVINENTELAQKMEKELAEWLKEVDANMPRKKSDFVN